MSNKMYTKKVLLVDDDIDQTEMYKFTFENDGFDVSVENDPLQAVQTAATARPDIILLDVLMEGCNGLVVLEQLKNNKATQYIPVMMLSNVQDKLTEDRAEELGAVDFWEKTKLLPNDIVKKTKKFLGLEGA